MFNRYFIGFLASVGLIIILIILIFHGGGGNKAKAPQSPQALPSYANTDAEVSLTTDGPINANQNHQQVKIIVSQNSAVFQQIQGYQGQVVNQKSYPNNEDAYSNFLYALEHAGFTQGNKNASIQNESGYCPLGDRYTVELNQDGNQLEHFWATSCGNPKTYLGDLGLTLTLFQAQIPDYNTLITNLSL